MPEPMDARMARLETEYEAVLEELGDPTTSSDPTRLRDLSRRRKDLEEVVSVWRELERSRGDVATAQEMGEEATGDDRDVVRLELERSEHEVTALEDRLRALLLPKDPNDGRNVIVEIRGGEGGEEANLFARDLYTMYLRFADNHHWGVEVLSESGTGRDGLNEVVFVVKGKDAWRYLENEAGPHRVQRVPVTESKGRVHTSAATVSILPEADEVDVVVDLNDLKIDVYRSTGPGGQSVNTTDSAVRITHIPTGIVVAMQDEKSQIQNRAKAMTVLRSRLLKAEQDRVASEIAATRRSQVGGGGRSEKVRTYNFKENRVTDHRIGLTVHRLDQVLAGDLDEFAEALMADKRARQLGEDDTEQG
jgi:peptide chain release factor 1